MQIISASTEVRMFVLRLLFNPSKHRHLGGKGKIQYVNFCKLVSQETHCSPLYL